MEHIKIHLVQFPRFVKPAVDSNSSMVKEGGGVEILRCTRCKYIASLSSIALAITCSSQMAFCRAKDFGLVQLKMLPCKVARVYRNAWNLATYGL